MFPTPEETIQVLAEEEGMSQSPQIGSMFPTCLRGGIFPACLCVVAIPSNRVNVSYSFRGIRNADYVRFSRNPLKSGQCFLLVVEWGIMGKGGWKCRNPLKSGQCFLPFLILKERR